MQTLLAYRVEVSPENAVHHEIVRIGIGATSLKAFAKVTCLAGSERPIGSGYRQLLHQTTLPCRSCGRVFPAELSRGGRLLQTTVPPCWTKFCSNPSISSDGKAHTARKPYGSCLILTVSNPFWPLSIFNQFFRRDQVGITILHHPGPKAFLHGDQVLGIDKQHFNLSLGHNLQPSGRPDVPVRQTLH